MKRILTALLALVMLLAVACTAVAESVSIAIVYPDTVDDKGWCQSMHMGVEKVIEMGYEIDYTPDGIATIRMTLTAPNCPMADMLVEDVNVQVGKVKHVEQVNVILTFDPVWDKSMMTEEALLELNLF